jgi:photosystem II stability/assembly factor-like uncharacterized protein
MSVPGVPQIHIRPKVTSRTIQFNWEPPASDGGSAITAYTIASAQDAESPYSIASTAREFVVTDLSNSVAYTYTITATNEIGEGPAATFRTVQPGLRAPQVPSALALKTDPSNATVTWTPTTVSGQVSPLLGYSIRTKLTGSQPPYTNHGTPADYTSTDISSLDLSNNGYVFRVAAVNDPGYSVALETNPVGNVQYTFTNPSATYPYVGSDFMSVAASSDGQKVVACADTSGSIWTSTNGGLNWVQRSAPLANWVSVASDASGTKLIAADQGGSLWTSGDSGVTWVERPAAGPSPQTWSYVAISANGTYALASAGVPGVATGYIYKSSDSGATWTQTGAPQRNDWTSLTVSNDGATMYATAQTQYSGPIYKSSNSGTTWTPVPYSDKVLAFYNIACSSDGTKLIAGDYGGTGVWTSTDSGVHWTNNPSYFQGEQINTTGSTVSSNDGTKLAVVSNNSVWTSGDSGATWTQETTPNAANLRMACDGSGATLYVVGNGNGTTGMYIWKGVYTSSWAWTQILISADLSGNSLSNFGCIACSKSGQYIYLAIVNLPIWKSSDYGATWDDISGSPVIRYDGSAGIACSDDGSTVLVFQYSVYVSSNYGVTWNTNTPDLTSIAGAVRSNKLVVGSGDSGNGIYISTNGGTTWTNSSPGVGANRTLTMSLDGQTIVVGGLGFIQLTTDGGTNWYSHPAGGAWDTIRVSADLTKLVTMNSLIYFSTNSGVSWETVLSAGFTTWTSIWVSADFTKMAATTNGGSIYYSTDSANTWTAGVNSGGKAWTGITGDSTGQYLVAVVDGGAIWFSRDYGARWYLYENPGSATWLGAAISADATTMLAGELVPWVSNNGGTDWREVPLFSPGTVSTFSSFISPDGAFMAVAINGTTPQNIWTSSDSGYTWLERTTSGARAWTGIAGSSDGVKLVAVADSNYIYTSTDSGATWTQRATSGGWRGAASDSTGEYLATTQYGGYIYTSDDSGITWTERATTENWNNIASDSTGQYLVAGNDTSIWFSDDYGVTWTQTSAPASNWPSITCSADGNNIIAGLIGANLWSSTDFGVTWNEQTGSASGNWYGVASSANAHTILAVKDYGDQIAIGRI